MEEVMASNKAIGNLLEELRKKVMIDGKRISIDKLCKRTRISTRTYYKFKRAKN